MRSTEGYDGTPRLRILTIPGHGYGNQISYTLKYNPEVVSFREFENMLYRHQMHVRCCSVMPQEDAASYEYQPEQGVSRMEFDALQRAIRAYGDRELWPQIVETGMQQDWSWAHSADQYGVLYERSPVGLPARVRLRKAVV